MSARPKSTSAKAQIHRLETAEIWLIRSGQHLFKLWRAKGRSDNNLEESFEDIWRLKREVRKEKRMLQAKMRSDRPSGAGRGNRGRFAPRGRQPL